MEVSFYGFFFEIRKRRGEGDECFVVVWVSLEIGVSACVVEPGRTPPGGGDAFTDEALRFC